MAVRSSCTYVCRSEGGKGGWGGEVRRKSQGQDSGLIAVMLWSASMIQHASKNKKMLDLCIPYEQVAIFPFAAIYLRAEYLSQCRGDSNKSAWGLSHSTRLRLLRWKHAQQLHQQHQARQRQSGV